MLLHGIASDYDVSIKLFLVPANAPQLVQKKAVVCGMYYPVCGMLYIKDPLLRYKRSNPWSGGIRFHLYPSGPLLYTQHIVKYSISFLPSFYYKFSMEVNMVLDILYFTSRQTHLRGNDPATLNTSIK